MHTINDKYKAFTPFVKCTATSILHATTWPEKKNWSHHDLLALLLVLLFQEKTWAVNTFSCITHTQKKVTGNDLWPSRY